MDYRLTWEKLLSSVRSPRPDTDLNINRSYENEEERTPFEQDYDRIVFSPPFRRLAGKTQVHPMASNDHIHNRLTHSIEVSSVGRSLGRRLARFAAERSDLKADQRGDIEQIMQAACLVHDIGNPPFGHAGEEVIRQWALEHREELFSPKRLPNTSVRQGIEADWLTFEGNAQGFRIAGRSDNPFLGYLRLTYATLGASIKYPWTSSDKRTSEKRKHNAYSTEGNLLNQVATELGLVSENGTISRHPLSFLTEAADDICYRIIDLEDAVEMGITKLTPVHELFLRISGNKDHKWMNLAQLRGQAITSLMNRCWKVFENDFSNIMNGSRTDDLRSSLDDDAKSQFEEIKELYNSIFGHRRKVATELGAYHVIGRIMKALVKTLHSLDDSDKYSNVHFLSKRTIDLTWGQQYAETNFKKGYAWWLSQAMDFVSGMTDEFAIRLSREIGGFEFSDV